MYKYDGIFRLVTSLKYLSNLFSNNHLEESNKFRVVNKYNSAKTFADNNIIIKEGNALLQVKKGDTLCIHALDHSIKSIGQELVAVCRYVCKTTGHLRYALFDLSELTIEDCEVEGYYDLL